MLQSLKELNESLERFNRTLQKVDQSLRDSKKLSLNKTDAAIQKNKSV